MPFRRRPSARRTRLFVTPLEAREVPAVTLASLADLDYAATDPLFVPLTGTSSTGAAINYSVSSDTAGVSATVVQGGRSLRLDVTGTDASGQAFTGTLTLRLFEDVAPLATGRVVNLTNSGFYNGLIFHRVIDNFVIQGGDPNGDGTGGSNLGTFTDEFNRDFTFNSNGILALANSGDDTNNSQFFITEPGLPLAQRATFLNYEHTIFGILTSGFDTFQKIITTNTDARDKPTNPVTITNASIFTDTQNGVARVQATSATAANITVSASDADGVPASDTFAATGVPDTTNDRAFLSTAVANQTVVRGGSTSFTIPGQDSNGDTRAFAVGTPGDINTAPANVTVSIDQGTGRATLTPAAGFTGTIDLLVGVRDQTPRARDSLTGALLPVTDTKNFDTQRLTLTVNEPQPTAVALAASRTTAGAGRPVLFTATVTGDNVAGGTVQFTGAGGTVLGEARVLDGLALLSTSFPAAGAQAVQATFVPASGTGATSSPVAVAVTAGAAPVAITAGPVNPGDAPRVTVRNADGTERFTVQAFDPSFTGGVRVAVADVNDDGQDDLVAVPGPGGSPLVRVFDGDTGNLVRETMVFEDTFRGGLYVDAADAFGLGYSQILVGAGESGGPRVTLYDASRDLVLLNYFAYDANLRGGVTVSLADLRGGEQFQILTGAGVGGGPQVNVYAARTAAGPVPAQLGSFAAGTDANRAGVRVGAGPLVSDVRNILVGPFAPDTAGLDQTFDPFAVGVFVG